MSPVTKVTDSREADALRLAAAICSMRWVMSRAARARRSRRGPKAMSPVAGSQVEGPHAGPDLGEGDEPLPSSGDRARTRAGR
jgi:hypothetical protein